MASSSERSSLPRPVSAQFYETEILRWVVGESPVRQLDRVASEEPLEIRVRGHSVAVTMRTPGHDAELAAGFLLSEGIIRHRSEVLRIEHCRQGEAAHYENTLNVFLDSSVELDLQQLTRHVFASSSCGLCGKASIEAVHRHFPPVVSPLRISAKKLGGFPERLRRGQPTFSQTGGLHAAALFGASDEPLLVREDIGRHNAVDKIVGDGLLSGQLPFDHHVLLVSGRASFEIMQKALAARIAIVAAISAPSSLAIEFAQESGQTLIGFLRGQSFCVYSHPQRIE